MQLIRVELEKENGFARYKVSWKEGNKERTNTVDVLSLTNYSPMSFILEITEDNGKPVQVLTLAFKEEQPFKVSRQGQGKNTVWVFSVDENQQKNPQQKPHKKRIVFDANDPKNYYLDPRTLDPKFLAYSK